jgi:antirestriction protein
MITLWVRELSSHNNGFSFDLEVDLDNYSNSSDLLEDLFEHTKENLQSYGEDLSYYEPLEEWMITDYSFDSNIPYTISEYESLDKLISFNETLNDLSDYDFISFVAMLDNNFSFEQALEKVQNGDSIVYELEGSLSDPMEELAYMFVEDGYYGEISDSISNYIDYQSIARDLEINGNFIEVEYENQTYIVDTLN